MHCTTQVSIHFSLPDVEFYRLLRIVLCFATPTFVILSEIILANKYNNYIPKDFFRKRLKYILSPFLVFAFIDALITYNYSLNELTMKKFILNILGNYEGYFIIIILQFYVLHYIVVKYKIDMFKFLPFSFIIMIFHLYLLNFSTIPFIVENRGYLKLPFTAWIGYFAIAYIIGSNYEKLKQQFSKFKWYIICSVLISLYFIYYSYDLGMTWTNSRRLDLFPLVISLTILILYIGSKLKSNSIVNLISNYSFGIYLLHWQVQRIITPYVIEWFGSTFTRVIGLFVITLIISMLVIKVFSLLPFGHFVVGNIRRNFSKKKNEKTINKYAKKVSA